MGESAADGAVVGVVCEDACEGENDGMYENIS